MLWVDAPCEFLRQVGFMYAPRTQAVRCVLETLTPPKMEDSPRCQSGQTGHNIPGAPIYLDSDFWLPLAIHGRRGQRQAEGVSVRVIVGPLQTVASRKLFGSATRPRSQEHRDSKFLAASNHAHGHHDHDRYLGLSIATRETIGLQVLHSNHVVSTCGLHVIDSSYQYWRL